MSPGNRNSIVVSSRGPAILPKFSGAHWIIFWVFFILGGRFPSLPGFKLKSQKGSPVNSSICSMPTILYYSPHLLSKLVAFLSRLRICLTLLGSPSHSISANLFTPPVFPLVPFIFAHFLFLQCELLNFLVFSWGSTLTVKLS